VKIPMRYIVAALLLVFAWKGSELTALWPPAPLKAIDTPQPSQELLKLAEPLKPILPRMLPKDRQYLATLYDAMAYVLIRDGGREKPIVGSNDQFAAFHAGTLKLAIDKAAVGKYPGLAEAIDNVFVNAIGADVRELSTEDRRGLIAACGVLSWSFGMGRDE
jgi:hypothetical protein